MTGVPRPLSVRSVPFSVLNQGRRRCVFLIIPPSTSHVTDHHPTSISEATVTRPLGVNSDRRAAIARNDGTRHDAGRRRSGHWAP